MAVLIDNPMIEAKVRTLASMTGETVQDAIATAADERIARIKPSPRRQEDPSVEEILAMVRSFGLQRIHDDRNEDEILDYGPNGYSE